VRARAGRRLVGLSLLLVAASTGCWRQPGFGPLRQGWNSAEDQLTVDNVVTLSPAWTARVADGPVRSDPVVSGSGAIHVNDDQAVYALERSSGDRRWRTPVVPPGARAGTRAGGITSDATDVYVAWGGTPDTGALARVDAATGALVRQLPGIGLAPPILSGPWRVQSQSGFVEETLSGAALSVAGPVSWGVTIGLDASRVVPAPTTPAITAERFFVGLDELGAHSDLLAAWDLDRDCGFVSPPVCTPDLQVALDGHPTTPVVASGEGTVYVATDAGTAYAVDTASGDVRWTAALGSPVTQRPAWTPSALYLVTEAGDLVALPAGGCGLPTCRPVWTTSLAGTPQAPPAVAGGVVYAASDGDTVEAFPAAGPSGCARLWSARLGSDVTGGPTVAHGLLLAGTEDGRVVAFRPPSGQLRSSRAGGA
jgi:outer membrane protein assembly factor BamB